MGPGAHIFSPPKWAPTASSSSPQSQYLRRFHHQLQFALDHRIESHPTAHNQPRGKSPRKKQSAPEKSISNKVCGSDFITSANRFTPSQQLGTEHPHRLIHPSSNRKPPVKSPPPLKKKKKK
ncbi:OLC1v1033777C1 [Oldenlandia corymbosa var. corymbosa]|uniref:OLC1v1033777C1 n=1 Tax=Oldenlandia corymbosa var. corymbosa TaxID=529605 RepID=A0AAV1CRP1_OLDCO|nr:OLC1v1033777C1 [Oldenlandia corymbosa var. corymbosa]